MPQLGPLMWVLSSFLVVFVLCMGVVMIGWNDTDFLFSGEDYSGTFFKW